MISCQVLHYVPGDYFMIMTSKKWLYSGGGGLNKCWVSMLEAHSQLVTALGLLSIGNQ